MSLPTVRPIGSLAAIAGWQCARARARHFHLIWAEISGFITRSWLRRSLYKIFHYPAAQYGILSAGQTHLHDLV